MDTPQVVNNLRSRLDALRPRLDELRAARRPFALAAMQGDAEARAELDDLTEKERMAAIEVSDLETALAEAERLLREEVRAVAEADADRKLAEANEIRDAMIAQAEKLDKAAAGVVEALTSIVELRRSLMSTGAIGSGYANRLAHAASWNRVMHHHGVTRFIDMPNFASGSPAASAKEFVTHLLTAVRRPDVAVAADAPSRVEVA